MRSRLALVLLAPGLLLAAVALAASPYAAREGRAIKALSEEQIRDLEAGRGMGLALVAELNGYPGPRHVLDLAPELGLDAAQRAASERLFAEMQAGAARIGAQIIEAEAALDRRFAAGDVDRPTIDAATAEIARLQGELRAHHLGYHLAMRALLTSAQTARYQKLRGYGGEPAAGSGGAHHRQH